MNKEKELGFPENEEEFGLPQNAEEFGPLNEEIENICWLEVFVA